MRVLALGSESMANRYEQEGNAVLKECVNKYAQEK